MRLLKTVPFSPISASDSNFIPLFGGTRNIQYIPVAEIFAFLNIDEISADFEIEHFSKVSIMLHISGNIFSMSNERS